MESWLIRSTNVSVDRMLDRRGIKWRAFNREILSYCAASIKDKRRRVMTEEISGCPGKTNKQLEIYVSKGRKEIREL